MSPEEVRQLLSKPTITPEELLKSRIFPLSRNGIYQAIERGEIAAIPLGRKKAVITAPLRKQLGIEAA
jgi:hypothetical protein